MALHEELKAQASPFTTTIKITYAAIHHMKIWLNVYGYGETPSV